MDTGSINKYIFVHIPRTAGQSVVKYLFDVGCRVYCPWSNNLYRDWTRYELLQLIDEDEDMLCKALHYRSSLHNNLNDIKIIHSHVVAFDENIIYYAKRRGWKIFTVIRDPVEQFKSIYNKFYKNDIKDFDIFTRYILTDYFIWHIPHWWRAINYFINLDSNKGLSNQLKLMLGIYNEIEIEVIDKHDKCDDKCDDNSVQLNSENIDRIKKSIVYAHYLQCLMCMVK